MSIPANSIYSNLMNGYFGYLSSDDQDALWLLFLQKNGFTTNPSNTDLAAQIKFSDFIEKTYESVQATNLSPEEVNRRQLLFTVFDIILAMMKSIQDNVAVTGNELAFLAKYQKVYTDEMKRIGDNFYIAAPTSTDFAVVNTSDVSKWTLGYGSVTMEEYLKSAVIKGAEPPPVTPPATPPLPLILNSDAVIKNVAQTALTLQTQIGLQNINVQFVVPPIVVSGNQSKIAFDITQDGSGYHLTIKLTTSTPPTTTTSTVDLSNALIADSGALTAFIEQKFQDFYFGPATNAGGKTVEALLKDPATVVTLPGAAETDITGTIQTFAQIFAQNHLNFTATASSITLTFDYQTVDDLGNTITIPVTQTATFPPDATLDEKLAAAKGALASLLQQTVGLTGKTVLQQITELDTGATQIMPLHIPWGNFQGNPIIMAPDGSSAANAAQSARASKNQLLQQYIENARSRREIIANVSDSARSQVQSTQQGLSALAEVLESSVQQLRTILEGIFTTA